MLTSHEALAYRPYEPEGRDRHEFPCVAWVGTHGGVAHFQHTGLFKPLQDLQMRVTPRTLDLESYYY